MKRPHIRLAEVGDLESIIEVGREVYPESPPWTEAQLLSHQRVFPQGQVVAVQGKSGRVVGYAASLIVLWDEYTIDTDWRDFTDHGMFTNHDPTRGRTLYGAEVMVRPSMQGKGIGSLLYEARDEMMSNEELLRIRAGARLRGYHKYADRMSPETYAMAVARGELRDPTVSFQLKRGFQILAVTNDYLHHDPESLGHAAVIEKLNPDVATEDDYAHQRQSPYFRAGS